jgi:uncharacterized heparinase superfamily protein
VNWVQFFLEITDSRSDRAVEKDSSSRESQSGEGMISPDWLKSLYQQALWLEQNIEYDLLANHYLKNGVALCFAGAYFDGVEANRWLAKGLRLLHEELHEQFLDDGGHFERSPMYHSICSNDYLDVLNLILSSPTVNLFGNTSVLTQKITESLNFLKGISLPDGDIPLLNDSAFGIAPTLGQITDYAKRVIQYEATSDSDELAIIVHSSSGYYVCRKAEDMIIIDCGEIGPNYQPGHAHCDILSYELAIGGRRVVVDSGVYDYEPSEERAYARSTRAHNTVMVDGQEQSEMWGVFRVARRARPLYAHIERMADGSVFFEGAHDGYRRSNGRAIHKRRVTYDGAGRWVITDMVQGTGCHRMESFVHLHPDLVADGSTGHCLFRERDGRDVATIEPIGPCRMRVERGWHFPEFGLKQENDVLVLSCSGKTPLSLSYQITKASCR